jgi:hypothetical protein
MGTAVLLALAVHQAVNIFRYSPLFASVRQWRDIGCITKYLSSSISYQLTTLLTCAWCLSVHVAAWFSLGYFLPDFECGVVLSGLGYIARGIVWSLAVSQLANLLHYLTNHQGAKHAG